MRGVVGLVLLLGVLPLSGAPRQTAPQAIPRFKAGVELVVLDVSVLDKDRQPVRALTADDFTVLEDGEPQAVASFSAVDLPDVVTEKTFTASWVQTVAPDVQRNTDIKDRRIVVIVMDDATPMPIQEVPTAKAVARQMIDALAPNDLACVVYTSYRRSGQEFSSDRGRLLAAVDRFNGRISPTLGLDKYGNYREMFFDEVDVAATTLYEGTLRTIQGLADDLAALPERRKALVLVSVGLPLDIQNLEIPRPGDMGSAGAGSTDLIRQLWQKLQASLDAARRSNVTVYGLDPGGLRAPGGVKSADPLHPGRLNQEFLKTVSENTGGFAITDTNAPAPQIQQLLRENASYYLVGYAPSNTRAQGRYRRVDVKVNRPEVTVRTRKGYFEAEPATTKKATAVSDASGPALGILPKADLPMSLAVAPFALAGQRHAALAIVVGVECPAPKRKGRVTERLDVQVAAYAPTGEERASKHQVMPVTVNATGEGGTLQFELLVRLDVPQGRYHLRVAADRTLEGASPGEDTAGRNGSVYTDVDVPDFGRETLALSGLSLNVSPAIMSGPRDAFTTLLPILPTTAREFGEDDRVTAFLRLYQGGDRVPVPVSVTARILDGKGATAFESSDTIGGERFASSRAADLQFDVPVARLSPGPYLLSVEARASNVAAKRDVRFAIK